MYLPITSVYTTNSEVIVLKINVKRTETETMIRVKSEIEGDPAYEFSLSPIITEENIKLVLPMMIKREREKRYKKAFRREEMKAAREEKADRLASSQDDGSKKNI